VAQFRTSMETGQVVGLTYDKGVLIFAGGESGLVVLNAINGAPLQATSLGSRAINAPAVVNETVSILTSGGYLYAFELASRNRGD